MKKGTGRELEKKMKLEEYKRTWSQNNCPEMRNAKGKGMAHDLDEVQKIQPN